MNYITSYPLSAIFYLSIIIITVLLSYIASRSENTSAKIYVFLIILILTSVAGFRGITVGIDTKNYIEVIKNIESMIGSYRIKPTEMGYAYYVVFLTSIINNPQVVLIVSALITNALIIIRLWSFRRYASFSFAVFIYVSMYYILTFNTMRQWIAIGIIFFAGKYLFEEKYFKFIIFVLIASTFHTTALVALLLIPTFIFYQSKDSIKSKNYLMVGIFLMPIVAFGGLLVLRSTSVISQYNHYFTDPETEFSLSWFVRVLIVIFLVFFVNPKTVKESVNSNPLSNTTLEKNIEFYKIIRAATAVGLILRSVGLFYEYTSRVGMYFSIFEIVLFSMVLKFKSYAVLLRIVIIILALLTFYSAMIGSGYGQMPYVPFWHFNI